MRRSRPGILNAVEAETLAYANFVESLFAVKFLQLKSHLREVEIEVKRNIDELKVAPHQKLEDRLNSLYQSTIKLVEQAGALKGTNAKSQTATAQHQIHNGDVNQLNSSSLKDSSIEESLKSKQQFLSKPQMVQFAKDVKNGFTIEQLVAKYSLSRTKVYHRIQLLQERQCQIPEPPFMTYEQLNLKLKEKLRKEHQQNTYRELVEIESCVRQKKVKRTTVDLEGVSKIEEEKAQSSSEQLNEQLLDFSDEQEGISLGSEFDS